MENKPSTIWSLALARKPAPLSRRPVVWGTSVFISQGYRKGSFYESRLVRVDLRTGDVYWEHVVSHVAGAPVVADDGVVFWARWDGSIVAFSPDGDLIWESEATRRNMRDPVVMGPNHLVACECAGQSERIQCLERKTGRARWRINLKETLGCRPDDFVVGRNHVAALVTFGEFDRRERALVGLHVEDGSVAWRRELPSAGFNPFVWRDAIHSVHEGTIHAHDLVTGQTLGTIEIPSQTRSAPRPLVEDGRVVLCLNSPTSHFVAAYDESTGGEWASLAWLQSLPEGVATTPEPIGAALGLLSEKGLVMFVDAASGELRARFVHSRGCEDPGGLVFRDGRLCVAHGRDVACYSL